MSSGMSEHLGDAKITLAIASFKSMGQFLKEYNMSGYHPFCVNDKMTTFQKLGKAQETFFFY